MPDREITAITKLTKQHHETLEKLDFQEQVQKSFKKWILTSVIAVMGTAGGSGGMQYLNNIHDNEVKNVIAEQHILAEQWRKYVDDDIKRLEDQQVKLREAVARLQSLASHHTSSQRRDDDKILEIQRILDDIKLQREPDRVKQMSEVDDRLVRKLRKEIFEE